MSLLILLEDGLGCPYLYEFMSLYRVSILDIVFLDMVMLFLFPCLFRDCVLVMGIFDCETIVCCCLVRDCVLVVGNFAYECLLDLCM
jgi:hypothetical protein